MTIHYYGIRHHGPGSARHLIAALHALQPDRILLEGPPEADALLPLVADAGMQPPVALLAYRPDAPQRAVYYPFAAWSPEWQTMQYAIAHHVPLTFCDLPLAYTLADDENDNDDTPATARHPFDYLADIAGYRDGEEWWEATVEQRGDGEDLFAAVAEAFAALRDALPEATSASDHKREAWMRKTIRAAAKDSERLAVICGAWHIPALQSAVAVKDDNALLKGLAKTKVDSTWIPWTNSRLTYQSGYGAGVQAPNWYAHLWQHPDDDGVRWLSQAAKHLRDKHYDISAAHLIETLRLARTTAALRGQTRVALTDYTDALASTIGMGDSAIIDRIQHEWLIGDTIGSVPENTPQLPLIADIDKQRKQLRLPQTAESREIILDLRKPLDLARSQYIHRLNLLDGGLWATPLARSGKGTYKEAWRLEYQPEQHIRLTEKAVYGNTLESAVTTYITSTLHQDQSLAALAERLEHVLPAELPDLVAALAAAIAALSVDNRDLADTLAALPHLAETLRYGNVRQTDTAALAHLLDTLLARLAAGGVQGCMNIDNDSAQTLCRLTRSAGAALAALNDAGASRYWHDYIHAQTTSQHIHPLLAGNAWRDHYDRQQTDAETVAAELHRQLSRGGNYADAAQWLEGFLYQSGTVLLVHDSLWHIINDWLRDLPEDRFTELLPLLRRTFTAFEAGERRQLGDKARMQVGQNSGSRTMTMTGTTGTINEEAAQTAMQTVARLLGLKAG